MFIAALTLAQQPKKLPAPLATKSVIKVPTLIPAPNTSFLKPAPGYKVNLFAEGLRHPRMMAIAPNGDVFVVQTRLEVKEKNQPNQVVVLHNDKGLGHATGKTLYADHLNMPFGIQFAFGDLYVANTGSVVRWPYTSGQRRAPGAPETILDGIPQKGYRNHWTRNIRFSPDRKFLFLTIGSEENVAVEGPRRAVIERYPVDAEGHIAGKGIPWTTGMRNPIGLDFNPTTGTLWANVAERDYLGDDLVPDFLAQATHGAFYGWPYYYIGKHHDPRMPYRPDLLDKVRIPDVVFQAHCTPIDIKFWHGDAIVAFHGSQNRSKMNGYKVQRIKFGADGKPTGKIEDLVTGWLLPGGGKLIYGRPAGIAILPDDSLLIADDWGGRIWRVSKS
jgi:glucose/arabinose dehydrogenase